MMNFSQIRLDTYDPLKQPHYENGETRLSFLPQEYSIVKWFKEKVTRARIIQGDRKVEDILIHDIEGEVIADPELFNGNLLKIRNNNWLVIRKEMFNRIIGPRNRRYAIESPLNISIETYNLINDNKNIDKVYSNYIVDIYSIKETKI